LRRSPVRTSRRNTTGRRPLNPRDTAARFIREFEEEYGKHELPFFQDGYAQAYDLAKKDVKFLLVILISSEHDDTNGFVRETLLSQEFVSFINNPQSQIILWAGDVQDSESYQVSVALKCTKFPFAALIVHTPQDASSSMSTVARITGFLPPSALVAKLQATITQESAALERVRSTIAEQQASRNIRTEQNSAYERSLAQDRERARQRREAEASRVRAEQEEKARAEAREEAAKTLDAWKRWKVQQIEPEPVANISDATRISIRMPSGDRVIRRFSASTTMDDLYAFIECHDLLGQEELASSSAPPPGYVHMYKFNLVSPLPREVFDAKSSGTVRDKIGRNGNLIVELITDADEGEEDEDDKEED
jgi:FAS-associated factor 2